MRLRRLRFTMRRMMAAILFGTLVAAVTIVCRAPGFGRGSLEHSLARLDVRRLGGDAERLWDRYRKIEPRTAIVPRREWPNAIRALGPERVYVTSDGVYVVTRSLFVEESGLFILPASSSFAPGSEGDPAYRKLAGKLFWYHIKG